MSIGEGDGNYSVRRHVRPDPRFVAVNKLSVCPGIDPALFAKIPRRIGDKTGDPGDMVNLLIIGSESAMQKVFATAGWVKVDADVRDAFLHGFMESMSKESYLTMPMSTLYLYGRAQDYGFAHAEPIQVVMARNHLRVWKAPFRIDGHVAWVGAATHDVGFERDQRNNGSPTSIDPDVDLERNYVEKTLTSTGLVSEVEHYLPDNPMKQAKTATGGSFYSDGHVLILKLNDDAGKSSHRLRLALTTDQTMRAQRAHLDRRAILRRQRRYSSSASNSGWLCNSLYASIPAKNRVLIAGRMNLFGFGKALQGAFQQRQQRMRSATSAELRLHAAFAKQPGVIVSLVRIRQALENLLDLRVAIAGSTRRIDR